MKCIRCNHTIKNVWTIAMTVDWPYYGMNDLRQGTYKVCTKCYEEIWEFINSKNNCLVGEAVGNIHFEMKEEKK